MSKLFNVVPVVLFTHLLFFVINVFSEFPIAIYLTELKRPLNVEIRLDVLKMLNIVHLMYFQFLENSPLWKIS